ncbi:MAG TPA: MauE/DoxX family redox-associated membrane protein [Acidimicrobiales bacterium]|nr:MauE/DoxX family redox-associated membrane protein [Acidimicrobiales bacterium]
MELIGLYLVAAGLLVIAGVAKAARPDDTARALGALSGRPVPLRVTRAAVRGGALAEALLGLVALLVPRPVTAALVALSYAAFAVVVAYAWRRGGPLGTCGCFGRPDTPPTAVHLVLDVAFAVVATIVAATAPAQGTLFTQLGQQPWAGLPLLFVSAVALWLSLLALSVLGALEGARRLVRAPS